MVVFRAFPPLCRRQPFEETGCHSIHANQFQLGGLADFYREAWEEFVGRRPPATSIFGSPKDERNIYLRVRRDFTKKEQTATIRTKLGDEMGSAWGEGSENPAVNEIMEFVHVNPCVDVHQDGT